MAEEHHSFIRRLYRRPNLEFRWYDWVRQSNVQPFHDSDVEYESPNDGSDDEDSEWTPFQKEVLGHLFSEKEPDPSIQFKTPTTDISEDIPLLRDIGFFIDYPNGELGNGLYGVVYRGYYGRNPQDFDTFKQTLRFAVKIMDFSMVINDIYKENFETEKFIALKVEHQNCVTIRYIVNTGEKHILPFQQFPATRYTTWDRSYLFMDYADRGPLSRWLIDNYNNWEPSTRINIMRDLFLGMRYLHQKQILHRDVHAGNVLLFTEENRLVAKWADFGISKTADVLQYQFRIPQITVEYFIQNSGSDIIKMFAIFERILANRNFGSETTEQTFQLNEFQRMAKCREFGSMQQFYNHFIDILEV